MGDEAEGLTRKAIEVAMEGDTALRMCLDRLAPARKDATVSDPPTAEELAELAQADAEGGPRIILHPRPSRNGLSAIGLDAQ